MKMLPKLAEKSLNSQRDAVLWNNCIVQHPIKEYRNALISATVTGKIDVRGET
jgi:hypothetical protein